MHHGAAMTTLRADDTPHTVRVGCVLIGDVLWSSGNQERLRTRLLRRDPRATLMVFNSRGGYLTAEGRVRLLEGDDVPELSVRLFRAMKHIEDAPPDALIRFGDRETTPERGVPSSWSTTAATSSSPARVRLAITPTRGRALRHTSHGTIPQAAQRPSTSSR